MQAFDSFFLHFYAFFLKFDTPSIENRHALKSQINALSDPFHISPARDYMRPRVSRKPFARPLQSQCRLSSFCSRVFSPALFLCSVPLPVSRPLFLFCRMLSGLFVCLFPGIGCRCSSFCSRVFSPALFLCSVPRGIPRFVMNPKS